MTLLKVLALKRLQNTRSDASLAIEQIGLWLVIYHIPHNMFEIKVRIARWHQGSTPFLTWVCDSACRSRGGEANQ